jgi:hypothetical protein
MGRLECTPCIRLPIGTNHLTSSHAAFEPFQQNEVIMHRAHIGCDYSLTIGGLHLKHSLTDLNQSHRACIVFETRRCGGANQRCFLCRSFSSLSLAFVFGALHIPHQPCRRRQTHVWGRLGSWGVGCEVPKAENQCIAYTTSLIV